MLNKELVEHNNSRVKFGWFGVTRITEQQPQHEQQQGHVFFSPVASGPNGTTVTNAERSGQ